MMTRKILPPPAEVRSILTISDEHLLPFLAPDAMAETGSVMMMEKFDDLDRRDCNKNGVCR